MSNNEKLIKIYCCKKATDLCLHVSSFEMEEFVQNFDLSIPIVLLTSLDMESNVMGYHAYRQTWKPYIKEKLNAVMEPENISDKYAVAVTRSEGGIVGHLPKGKSGRFAKTIFYFLRACSANACDIEITGAPVNIGDEKGMKVPCKLTLSGEKIYIDRLDMELAKLM